MPSFAELKTRLQKLIWGGDITALSPLQAQATRLMRVVYATIRDLRDGRLTLQAMGLVYTTLLSLVPLLAVSFSVLKGFGVHNQVEPVLLSLLTPLGEKGVEITSRIIGFVENIRVGVLGAVGLGLLIYTVSSLIQKVERAFNEIWYVKEPTSLAQRFSKYLSVLTVGPVLVFAAIGVTASLLHSDLMQSLVDRLSLAPLITFATKLIPYVLIIIAFAFIYIFIPNTKVRTRSAFVGALLAGILWEFTGWVFASFVATSTNYTAIYSGFAILILFMVWLHLSWLILLVGASIAFYHQHPEQQAIGHRPLQLSHRLSEQLALLIMVLIGQHYYQNLPVWTRESLAKRLNVPVNAVDAVIQILTQHGILSATCGDEPHYLPARALETIGVKELLDTVRAAHETTILSPGLLNSTPEVDQLLSRTEQAMDTSLHGTTLRSLITKDVPGRDG